MFAVIFAIVFREPRENERSQVSPERKSFKEVLPFFKSRQLWCLILMFAIYNYINYGFSQYLKTWMQTPELLGCGGRRPVGRPDLRVRRAGPHRRLDPRQDAQG